MRKPAYTFLRRGRKTCQMDIPAHGNRPYAAIPDLKFIPRPISIFRPPQNLALWLFVSSDPRHPHGAPPPGRAPLSCLRVCPPACMRLFVSPRFTLSLSGTHTLRSLLRSLRYVLPSEGVAVSVSRYCIARGKAHTGHGTRTLGRVTLRLRGAKSLLVKFGHLDSMMISLKESWFRFFLF